MRKINNFSLSVAAAALEFSILITMCAAQTISAQTKNPNKFKIGVFRADGTIIPFAEYRHGLWWNPWAEPARQIENNEEIPKSLGNQPEPWFHQYKGESSTWYFRSSTDITVALKARHFLQVDNHSNKNWAVMTDYPQKIVGKKDNHHSQIGIAVDADLKIDGMIEIEKNSPEASNIVSFLKPIFNSAETEEIARHAAEGQGANIFLTGYPAASAERAKVDVIVTDLQRGRYSIDGRQIYYVQMEKQYGKPPYTENLCAGGVTFLYGWVTRGKDGTLALVNEKVGLTDCDGKERGSSVVLFSVMTLNNRTFIFTVEHGWEDESYVIYELTDAGINRVLETFGG